MRKKKTREEMRRLRGDDYDDEDENCPAKCHCSPRVVQCSDQGQKTLLVNPCY